MKPALPSLSPTWNRRLRLGALALAALVALFGLLGYFWLPGFAKSKLETLLSEQFHRPVTVEKIDVSPYTLSATVEGFKVGDVLAFKSLYVNVSASSLARGIPVVSEVRLVEPELHLVRESADRLNISDLLDEWLNKPESPTPEFSVSNIRLEGGKVEWQDKVAGGHQTVSDIQLGIPFVANVPSAVEVFVEPRFAAKINGAPLAVEGKLRPFAQGHDAQVDINLDKLDLTPLAAYVKLPVKLASLKLSSRLEVHFAQPAPDRRSLSLAGSVSLSALDASLLADHARLKLARLDLDGIAVDVFRRTARVETLTLSAPDADLKRDGPDSLDFARLAAAPTDKSSPKAPAKAAKPTAPAPAAAPSQPWQWSLGKAVVEKGRVRFADSTVPKALPLVVDNLALNAGPAASDGKAPVAVDLKAAINQRGSLALNGKASLKGDADFDLDLRKLELVALQGWAADRFNALLTKGDLSFKGKLHWQDGAGSVDGDLELGDFNILDRVNAEDLLRWKSLQLTGLAVRTPAPGKPLELNLGDVALRDFFAKVLINPQGQLNLKDLVKHDAAEPAAATKPAVPAGKPASAVAVAPQAAAPAPVIKVGKVRLEKGSVNFNDRFIKPNYSARITDLSGRVGALAAGTLSPVELHGKVERTAPLDITGKVDPFSKPLSLELRASARGIDLPALSAYSSRYVGYGIEKGKLSVDVNYKVDHGQLSADNHVFLDQLTFSDTRSDSKDALNLPVHLAVALLRNGRGEIDVNLPISGSLNDPQFSVGGIILKVIGNLIVKAVTAPFTLLGSLFGGGEDLSQVAFPSGQVQIAPAAETRLQALAKAMADRPGLRLEITGSADPVQDKDGLRRALLDRKLRALKQADLARQGKAGGKLSDIQIGKDEYPAYLEKAYKAADIKDKPRNLIGLAKSLPVADMEALLLANQAVGDGDLLELAEERGQRVQAWLVDKGVPQDRLFLRSARVEEGKDKAGGLVAFSLK